MDKYYVYAILRPDRPGNYTYQNLEFEHEPFYIGKGSNDRIKITLYSHHQCKNPHKIRILNFLKINKIEPIIKIIYDNLNESEALALEQLTIKQIGRNKNGPLVNLTDGGEGSSGHKQPDKQKAIYAFDLMGVFKYEFESSYDASKILGIHASLINRCLYMRSHKAGGMTYTTRGYIFKFKSDFKERPNKIDVSYLKNKKGNGPKQRKVKQIDANGKTIGTYDSIKNAAEKTGCLESKIVCCCKNKRTHHNGYKWEYCD